MKVYVKYLALCLGLSQLPPPLRRPKPCSFNWFNRELFSLQYFSWTTQPNIASEIGEIQYTVTQQDQKNHKFIIERCFH